MKSLESLWMWIKAKFGRIVSGLGFLLQGADLDISPIKPTLESLFSHTTVEWMVVSLFAFSWLRHQWVANQHPKADPLPSPDPGAVVKP